MIQRRPIQGVRSSRRGRAALFVAAALAPLPVYADSTYIGPSGNWSLGSNWSLGLPPGNFDNATLTSSGGAVVVTFDAAAVATNLGGLTIDAIGGGSITFSQALNSLTVSGDEIVGFSGAGAFNHTGGSNTADNLILGFHAGSSGTYTLAGSASLLVNFTEFVGHSGAGTFNQTGGVNNSPNLSIGYRPGSSGSYSLSGDTASLTTSFNEYVGYSGNGVFSHTGGTNSVPVLVLGYRPGSIGSYTLANTGSLIVGFNDYVGYSGIGTFTQTGGVHTTLGLTLALNAGSSGVYNMSDGTLANSGAEIIGNNTASGIFNQSGGSHTVGGDLRLGVVAGSTGIFNLSGTGALLVNLAEYVGLDGSGTFNQSSGINTAANVAIGFNPGSTGSYTLSNSATLQVGGGEYVGFASTGVFNQVGGVNNVFNLTVGQSAGSSGTYTLSGGTLTNGGLEVIGNNGGSGTFNHGDGSHSVGGDLVLAQAPGSTAIYNLTGAGSLNVSGNEFIGADGTAAFNMSAGNNTASNMAIGFNVGSSGSYTQGDGTLLLVSGNEFVGYLGSGAYTQTGGSHFAGNLVLGYNAGSSGVYALSGGSLGTSSDEYIGFSAPGTLVQTGGKNSCSIQYIGVDVGGTGTYTQSDGDNSPIILALGYSGGSTGTYNQSNTATLSPIYSVIGVSGTGVFNQSGGNHNVGNTLYLGYDIGGNGIYNLSGAGVLVVGGPTVVGFVSAGSFNQSGGTHSTDVLLLAYNAGSSGTYTLTAGVLAVGIDGEGHAFDRNTVSTFLQSGGSHTIAGDFVMADGFNAADGTNPASATYQLDGGSLAVAGGEIIGFQLGNAVVNQTGGTHTVTGTNGMVLAALPTATGTYNLMGGTASATNVYIGGVGTNTGGLGRLNISGGTISIPGTLQVYDSAAGTNHSAIFQSGGTLTATNTVVLNGPFTQTGGVANLGTITGTGSMSLGGGASARTTVRSFALASVMVSNNATLSILPAATRLTHTAANLTIAGNGTLDLANHELLTNTAPATIKTYLANAYDPNGNADWAKPGLTSSLAKGDPVKYSVGYAYGGDQSAQDAGVATHGGAPIGANQTIARAVLAGDANMDGTVDFFDIAQILGYKYRTNAPASYTDGDLDYSGTVDFFDLAVILSANYRTGATLGPAQVAQASGRSATPSLTGGNHSGVVASATTIGLFGDGKPGFEYNPATGDLIFRANGATFTTSGGQASFVSTVSISSTSGELLPNGASVAFDNGTGVTLTVTQLSSALLTSPGFQDGFDLGNVLPPALFYGDLANDLTLKYQVLNGGGLKAASILALPEPSGLGLLAVGAAALLSRRKQRRPQRA